MEQTSHKFFKGILWNSVEKILVKGSSFVITVILARLLTPEDYGIVGMLAIFIALSNVFIESGFSKALIQKQDADDNDYSTAFLTNLGIAVLVYGLLFLMAPLIARFYEVEQLVLISRVLFLNLIIVSCNIVQNAILTKEVDFKSIAKINFTGVLVGGLVGIGLAYWGAGVWALVAQTLATSVTRLLVFPFYSRWYPKLKFSIESFRSLFGFGSKLLLSGSMAVIVNNISTICIGKFYSQAQLGFYTRAVQFSEIISSIINDVVGTVSYPVLSNLQQSKDEMLRLYKQSLLYTSMLTFPIMVMTALLAHPLVLVLLTEKWLPCVVLLQILCLARMFTPISALNINILNAHGRTDLTLKIESIKIAYGIVALMITIPIGVKAIVIGNLVTTIISFFVNTYYPGKLMGYGALKMLRDWRYILYSVVAMAAVVFLLNMVITSPLLQILVSGTAGFAVYLAMCVMFRQLDLRSLYNKIRKRH